MPGMDGWTLLNRLRAMEETARMPIALMAGVLDPVDPARLAKAPIQGFLKKPIELRELGDRVKALLATVVAVAPSPFSTVPATLAKDLMQRPEKSLPEYRPEPEPVGEAAEPVAFDDDFLSGDEGLLVEEDLLVLDAGDLWPEEPPAQPAPVVAPAAVEPVAFELPVEPVASLAVPDAPDVQLELEELDFDSLQNLTDEPLPTFEPIPGQPAFVPPAELMTQGPKTGTLPEPFPDVDLDPKDMELEEIHLVTMSGLEELDAFPSDFQLPEPPVEVPVPAPTPTVSPVDDDHDLLIAASLAAVAGAGVVAHDWSEPTTSEPPPAPPAPPVEASVVPPAATGQAPAAPGQAVPSEQAQALVQALLADPVLVDALVKAVVARMGDQVLREIAWEVMPDLAGRLQR
jgi:CheY-like chemotaxis protein